MSAFVKISGSKFKIGRFVVSASKITELKEKVISLIGRVEQYYPSRVELVLGKLSKCAAAVVKSKTGSFKPTVLFQGANPRGRMDPPLPDTLFGNFVWQFAVIVEEESDLELHKLVQSIRETE
nr:vinorine synthase [Quercus suber]